MLILRVSLLSACCWLVVGQAVAQPTGNLHGTITGEQSERLPGATVTLTGYGADRTQLTDDQGNFRFLGLDPGRYSVEARLEGFSIIEYPGVEVRVGRNVQVDLSLSRAVQETMTITAESSLLDERRRATGTTVTQLELEKIPAHRNPLSFLRETPDVLVDRIEVSGDETEEQPNFLAQGLERSENEFLVDGVNVSDPYVVGASAFPFDIDQYAEMSFTTGGTDVTKNTAGVAVSLVTKRGTNEFRGSARFYKIQADGYFGGLLEQAEADIEDELYTEGGQTELIPSRYHGRQDAGFEAGGAALPDRLWLWGSWSQNDIDRDTAGGFPNDVLFENAALRLNAQLGRNNSLVAAWNNADKVRTWGGAIDRAPETVWDQRGPSAIYRFEDAHVFSSRFFVTGTFSIGDSGFDLIARGPDGVENGLDPAAPDPVFAADGVWRENFLSGSVASAQDEFKIDASYFFGAGAINHELRVGGRLRTAEYQNLFQWGPRNVFHTFWGTTVAGHSQTGPATTEFASLWVQDTISVGNLTINAGLRYDQQTGSTDPVTIEPHAVFPQVLPGFSVEGKETISWESLTPRVGMTYALGEERDTLLRASFSQFAGQLGTGVAGWTSPTYYTWYAYFFSGFLYAAQNFDPLDPTVSPNRFADNFDPETTSELILEVEHALLPEFVVGARLTYRETEDIIDRIQMVRDGQGGARPATPEDYEIVGTVSGTVPRSDTSYSVPVWDLIGQKSPFDTSAGAPTGGLMLINGPRTREYVGGSISFTKRLSNRWMARGFFNYGDAEWQNVPAFYIGCPPTAGANNQRGGGCQNGDLYAPRSNNRGSGELFMQATWSFNLNGMVQIAPDRSWGFNVSGNLNGREAHPVAYYHGFPTTLGNTLVNVVEPVDQQRLEHDPINLDLRIEKEFGLAGDVSLTFGIDAFNVLNTNAGVSYQARAELPTAGYLLDHIDPRTWQLGVRVQWR